MIHNFAAVAGAFLTYAPVLRILDTIFRMLDTVNAPAALCFAL
jgi:hypothetical protein